jgi:hypothetical protein
LSGATSSHGVEWAPQTDELSLIIAHIRYKIG